MLIVTAYALGRQKLLEGPTPREPSAPRKDSVGVKGKVAEIHVTHICPVVPVVHGVDCLGQLGAALLIDTAGVYPEVVIAVMVCLDTAALIFL